MSRGEETEPRPFTPHSGAEGFRFDDSGMVLPHSILGSFDDFRKYLEAKGETELVKHIPESESEPAGGSRDCEATVGGSVVSPGQCSALHNWDTHMRQRRRQLDYLSATLHKPVKTLLMNQANNFRDIQEQREFLSQVKPFVHPGYGYRVGSEFWSLPQRYGDEVSGITATLSQTERGRHKPVTHVGQPSSIRQESGAETQRPASHAWDRSSYLQHQYQELRELLQDMDYRKPDISGLEVIGSGKPLTCVSVCRCPTEKKEDVEREPEEEVLDQQREQQNNDPSSVLSVPTLKFCGQIARWTGNDVDKQGEVGISAPIFFEALTGDMATSHMEMSNEGNTAIFYSWQQLPTPRSFHHLQSQPKKPHFYFNSSSGVILPGETQRVDFTFKSAKPGIKTGVWQLNTQPLLLQGASIQLKLRGVSLYRDKTAVQRHFLQAKLEKTVSVKLCESFVGEVVRGVQTPQRPGSPAENYTTAEQIFLKKNPKLTYRYQPVDDLKRLWRKVNPEHSWDLCVDTLRQTVLSLPEEDLMMEKNLAQLNSLLLELSGPSELKRHDLTAATIGHQLWIALLDRMADEAMWLKNLLGRTERETGMDRNDESLIFDADLPGNMSKDEKSEKNEEAPKIGRSRSRSRFKDEVKEDSKSSTTEKSVQEIKKKAKRRDEAGKRSKEKQRTDSFSMADPESLSQQLQDEQILEPKMFDIYTRLLHRKVYALMEDLVDTLCDLMDGDEVDLSEEDTRETEALPHII